MTTLDMKAAFFHVIDSHRWLASSGCAWNVVGPSAAKERQFDKDMPNIDVMVRDCLLLHARSLIKFYRNKGRPDDILLFDFNIPKIPPALDAYLDQYERPTEVHLLHLTDWRDVGYRSSHPTAGGTIVRPDWNHETSVIAEKLIFECLKFASAQSGKWQTPFKELYDAAAARYRDKSHEWPTNLCEKFDVEQHLRSLGL
jgi:hypothetical protein